MLMLIDLWNVLKSVSESTLIQMRMQVRSIIKEINQYIQFCPIKPCEFGIKKESLLPFRRIRKLHLIPS